MKPIPAWKIAAVGAAFTVAFPVYLCLMTVWIDFWFRIAVKLTKGSAQ